MHLIYAYGILLLLSHQIFSVDDRGKKPRTYSGVNTQVIGLVMVTFATGTDCYTVCNEKFADLMVTVRNPIEAKEDYAFMLAQKRKLMKKEDARRFYIEECLHYRRVCIGVSDVWLSKHDSNWTIAGHDGSLKERMKALDKWKAQGASLPWSLAPKTRRNFPIIWIKSCMCERILFLPQVRFRPTEMNLEFNLSVNKFDCAPESICKCVNEKIFDVGVNQWFCKVGVLITNALTTSRQQVRTCICSDSRGTHNIGRCLTEDDVRIAMIRSHRGPLQITSYQSSEMYPDANIATTLNPHTGTAPGDQTLNPMSSWTWTTMTNGQLRADGARFNEWPRESLDDFPSLHSVPQDQTRPYFGVPAEQPHSAQDQATPVVTGSIENTMSIPLERAAEMGSDNDLDDHFYKLIAIGQELLQSGPRSTNHLYQAAAGTSAFALSSVSLAPLTTATNHHQLQSSWPGVPSSSNLLPHSVLYDSSSNCEQFSSRARVNDVGDPGPSNSFSQRKRKRSVESLARVTTLQAFGPESSPGRLGLQQTESLLSEMELSFTILSDCLSKMR